MGAYCCPKVRDAMFKGLEKPDFSRIKVPFLAFFAALSLLKTRFASTILRTKKSVRRWNGSIDTIWRCGTGTYKISRRAFPQRAL